MNTLKNKAENIYEKELRNIYNKLSVAISKSRNIKVNSRLGKGITYGSDLNKLARSLFGSKFKGVFASDQLDKLKKEDGYYIFNLDKSDEPGSHWIGVIKSPKGIMVYDSFGRKTREIAPGIYSIGNVRDTEDDAEQKVYEDDCGARTISWMKVYDDYGPAIASWI